MDRRSFLKGAAVTATAAAPFTAFIQRASAQDHKGGLRRGQTGGYGPLFPTLDRTTGLPLLLLPEGFKYLSFGWSGDLLDNGQPTPGAHDGMAAFTAGRGRVRLVRNHEVGAGVAFSAAAYNVSPVEVRRLGLHDQAQVVARHRPDVLLAIRSLHGKHDTAAIV